MNLSMEATSLYLLLEGLGAKQAVLLEDECRIRWNAADEDYDKGREELLLLNIIEKKGEGLKLVSPDSWRTN
ncbi:hypothetical protein [Maridesulfovibrio bastinii]|uniref:hypothetical protein n=1 Tax=Maridesulfovibrio bastinii TaxID=47157 RepID=UPI0003FA361C|nr:hypothetical protein [Maridesulfovibrio bastinii]